MLCCGREICLFRRTKWQRYFSVNLSLFHIHTHTLTFVTTVCHQANWKNLIFEKPSRCVYPNLYNTLCTVNTQHTSGQDAIITIGLYLATCFGHDRPSSGQLRTTLRYSKKQYLMGSHFVHINLGKICKFLFMIKVAYSVRRFSFTF